MDLQKLFEAIAPLFASALLVFLVYLFSQVKGALEEYLRGKGVLDEVELAQKYAEQVVRFLEQLGKMQEMTNEQKKSMAMLKLSDLLMEAGIKMSAESVDRLIEWAVNAVKNSFPPAPVIEPLPEK